jgi:putative DNA primase/helicase
MITTTDEQVAERQNGHGRHTPITVPNELATRRIWVLWKIVEDKGKPTKRPFQTNGRLAKSNDATTWNTLEAVQGAYATGKYNGIGLAFSKALAGIDLDSCIDEAGTLADWARDYLALLPPTYTEISPSGRGLHLIYLGELPEVLRGRELNHTHHVGIATYCYPASKYFTFTGSPWPIGSTPAALANVKPEDFPADDILALYAALKPHKQQATAAATVRSAATLDLSDQDIITRAMNASNGTKFTALWKGSIAGYPSASDADLALCNLLAFWTSDPAQIERLWIGSGLRTDDKKIDRADYRKRTIDKALADVTTTYNPNYRTPATADDDMPPVPDGPDDPTLTDTPTTKPKKEKKFTSSQEMIEALADLGYTFRLNLLSQQVEVNGTPLTDNLAAEIRVKMRDQKFHNTKPMEDAYTAHALHNAFHPIKEYLNGLQWNELDHIAQLGTYLRSDHAPFENGDTVTARFMRRWLIGAVGKVFDKIQTPMLVLEGKQNLGKSHFVAWLGSVLPGYFIEGPIAPDDKDSKIRLMSRFLWEVSELGATTRRADVEALKSFVTLRDVTVRLPYGHHDVTVPAVCSLIGTLNDSGGFLNDTTGSRRFLTIALTDLFWDYRKFVDVAQVWAQAVALYRAGESPNLTPEERDKQAEINAGFTTVDPVEDILTANFAIDAQRLDWVTSSNELRRVVDDNLHGTSIAHARSIAAFLKSRGIVASRPYVGGSQMRGYRGVRVLEASEMNAPKVAQDR